MGHNVCEFTDANFATEVLQATQPVLVDFWAPWCGPCRQIAPLIEQLATDNLGAVKIGKMNIDEHPSAAQEYGVSAIPTLLLFKGGQVTERWVGHNPSPACNRPWTKPSNHARAKVGFRFVLSHGGVSRAEAGDAWQHGQG